jgi:hypothetical protein
MPQSSVSGLGEWRIYCNTAWSRDFLVLTAGTAFVATAANISGERLLDRHRVASYKNLRSEEVPAFDVHSSN